MERLSLYSIDLAGQFDNLNEGIKDVFRMMPVESGGTLYTTKVTGELAADISHVAGEEISISDLKREYVEIGKIDFDATGVKTSYQEIYKTKDEGAAVGDKDEELIRKINEHIENRLVENMTKYAGDKALKVEGLTSLLAQAKGHVQVKPGMQGAPVIAFINTLDFYEHLGNVDIQDQTLFGMSYIENFLQYDKIFITSKVKKGKVLVTAAKNLNLAYVPVNSESFSTLGLSAADSELVGFKHFLEDSTGDVISKVHFGIDSFPNRADAVVYATIKEPLVE